LPALLMLFSFVLYSCVISLIYGAQEIVFFLKFARTFVGFFLLYYVVIFLTKKITYDEFCRAFVVMVFLHSILILAMIIYPEMRSIIYSLTGYEPRGPEWSRSPGLTISFNSTAILHITALWMLVAKKYFNTVIRAGFIIIIMVSLVFLGRFVSFLGIITILMLLIFNSVNHRINRKTLFFLTTIITFVLFIYIQVQVTEGEYDTDSTYGQLMSNVHHFVSPLINFGENEGVDSYYSEHLSNHLYLSDRWYVILFGDSIAGHIGITREYSRGETNSDIGLVNSINANGLIVTILIFLFYFILVYEKRSGDWQTLFIISFLSLALSFKETGLFTSHATQLLFIIYFYRSKKWESQIMKKGVFIKS